MTTGSQTQIEKVLRYGLILALILMQYPLWFGTGSVFNVWRLKREINVQHQENEQLARRNRTLEAEVVDLKHGMGTVEERARSELGMIKKDETFFQIVEPPSDGDTARK